MVRTYRLIDASMVTFDSFCEGKSVHLFAGALAVARSLPHRPATGTV